MINGYEIVYEKGDNSILHRKVKNRPVYSIGDKTSYGWVVKEINYIYSGKSYTYDKYIRLMNKFNKKNDLKNFLFNINLSNFLKIVIELLVVYFLCVKFFKF